LSREKGINELFERAAKRVPGEGKVRFWLAFYFSIELIYFFFCDRKTKALEATAVRLSKEWSAVLEVHEVPSSLVKKVRGIYAWPPKQKMSFDRVTGATPRNHDGLCTSFNWTRYVKLTTTRPCSLHALTLFEKQPVTSAPEEVQLSLPIKRLSIVGGVHALLFALLPRGVFH
jgi:hypothetical protein